MPLHAYKTYHQGGWGWGCISVSRVLASYAQGPKFNTQHVYKAGGGTSL